MGNVIIVLENCKGCGYCVVVCPKNILKKSEASNKMVYRHAVVAGPDECIACKLCAIMCPYSAIEVFK